MLVPKVALLPALTSIRFTTLAMSCVDFTLLHPQGSQVYFTLYLVGKLKSRRTLTGSAAISTQAIATAIHFPANAGLIFLTDKLTKIGIWLILEQLFPVLQIRVHLALLNGADG